MAKKVDIHNHTELFMAVLNGLTNGLEITFTKDNVDKDDDWLNLRTYPEITAKFTKAKSGIWWVAFDEDERTMLEDCPNSFLRSIYKNL